MIPRKKAQQEGYAAATEFMQLQHAWTQLQRQKCKGWQESDCNELGKETRRGLRVDAERCLLSYVFGLKQCLDSIETVLSIKIQYQICYFKCFLSTHLKK